ncbi:MAG: cysteine synthase CysM [Gemmatimonadales bacterium]|nr:MAG: cysteine synthase CysM [Gemmatimonadales bacterium]
MSDEAHGEAGVGDAQGGAPPPRLGPHSWPTIESTVGRTPLVRLQRMVPPDRGNVVLAKLEGNNPAGSVKDRPAMSMIRQAEERGEIEPGDTLIEATSGNTGIALAMAAAVRGYRLVLLMPESATAERKATMKAYGAKLVEVPEGMETARDRARAMEAAGEGRVLDQFANPDNPRAHTEGTGPEIWEATGGRVTHFVSSLGTTGTSMGTSAFLKEQDPHIVIVGTRPADGARIPGIRRWPPKYQPKFFDPSKVDRFEEVTEEEAILHTRRLAREEGILAGMSSGGTLAAALRIEAEVRDAVIVSIVCDRGDRYLSSGLFDD